MSEDKKIDEPEELTKTEQLKDIMLRIKKMQDTGTNMFIVVGVEPLVDGMAAIELIDTIYNPEYVKLALRGAIQLIDSGVGDIQDLIQDKDRTYH